MNRTKIVATIGPACSTRDILIKLGDAGVSVCRLNLSFGDYASHLKTLGAIRSASKKLGRPLGVLMDLQGPKIRVGQLPEPFKMENGEFVVLSGHQKTKKPNHIPTTYAKIASDTKKGKTILLADGRISLKVVKTVPEKREVHCVVLNGGTILTGKGINLPDTNVSLPALTPKDRRDAKFGLEAGVDFMGLSFVRRPEDVLDLRRLMKRAGREIPIIAKIEKPEAVSTLDAILDTVNGVMVARGDLAVEISFAKVPRVQKEIIRAANKKGKHTIVATEMLSSMTENPRPTRAEASDVANAVLDGADAVMLSNETSVGKHPVLAVKAMSGIVAEAEKMLDDKFYHQPLDLPETHEMTESMCAAASFLSNHLDEKALAVITHSGRTARILSKYRPDSVIFAGTFDPNVYNMLSILHNVEPILLDPRLFDSEEATAASVKSFIRLLSKRKLARKGDKIVFLVGNIQNNGWKVDDIKVAIV